MQNIKNCIKKHKKGSMSIPFVILCVIACILVMMIMGEYQSILIIRNFEAASDLAAVEALRAYVDEESLRDEVLDIKESNYSNIRDLYLEKLRASMPSSSASIVRIEIPEINSTSVSGKNYTNSITIPQNYDSATFPYSTSNNWKPYNMTDASGKQLRSGKYLGTDMQRCSISISKDTSNLNTSGKKDRTSYFISVNTTIIFKTNALMNQSLFNLVNYVDIVSDSSKTVSTIQVDKATKAVTIQTLGKVTLE